MLMMSGKLISFFPALLIVLLSAAIQAQPEPGRDLLPPHGIRIDPESLVVTWKSPGIVLLNENFEGETFPPSGWQANSFGNGWQRMDTLAFNHWKIPEHFGHYAISNDDGAAGGNNGNADLLITPAVDLTGNDSLTLMFDSYFDGAYGQSARVEYSIDGGSSWITLEEMTASLVWLKKEIDLSDMSGSSGLNNVKFAFHSSDNGYNGSGWAIDNVEIANSPATNLPVNYIVIMDTLAVDTTTGCSAFIPTIVYTYNEEHSAGVCACYPEGNSDTVFFPFVSKYLFPVYDLQTEDCGDYCIGLTWWGPYRPPDCWPWELQSTFQTPDYWTEGGCDSWDESIYIVYENINRILKMDLEGNVQGMLIIPGVPPLTDITHDYYGNFYGCCGTNIIYIMDFETSTLIGQFFAPVQAHALAASEWGDLFFANNISSDITVFSQDEVYLTFPVGNFGNIHSLAYNEYSDVEHLYAFSRDSTGCLIVEYNAWQGTPTGFTKDLSGLAPGGLAGGLYTDFWCSAGCVTLGGTIQNELAFSYTLNEYHCPGWTPRGIWGYYIYKNEELFDSIEIICARYPWYTWYPEDSLPRSENFSVSVKYDLEELLGLKDQIAFSEKAGPVQADISYGHALDFVEEWASSNFNHNKWTRTSTKWEVNTSLGNPHPAACFRGSPGTGPYSVTLTSYPFLPDTSQPCGISLSYDLKLMDDTPSGIQSLETDIWDSETRVWHELKEYHNDTVWNGFITENIDVTNRVKGRFSMIRFIAYGENSSDIQFWVLDNIKVQRTCPPPEDLIAEYDSGSETITLNWTSPLPELSQWFHWDDSLQNMTMGLTSEPDTWCDLAARWDSSMLAAYQYADLERIAFIPADPETHYILKVWTGDSGRNLRAEQAVADLVINQWNFIDLDNPVKIDSSEELWVGYSYSTKGQDPVSLDGGPAVNGFGNLCRIGNGEWSNLLNISPEWNGNINIQAFIHQPERYSGGYRLFKSIDYGAYQYLADVTLSEYNDNEVTLNLMNCYKVQSSCIPLPDTLFSDFSVESCILPVNVNEFKDPGPGIRIYPNPAEEQIAIQAPEIIKQIDILDRTGSLVKTFMVNEMKTLINLSSLKSGIYLITTKTGRTSYFNKIVVVK